MLCPTEHIEQVTFIREFENKYKARIFAIPNGGFRHKTTAQKLKAEGVKKGVPDLFIPEWLLWVEMKRVKGGSVSADQKDWHNYLESIGHSVIVAKGYEHGLREVEAWNRTRTTKPG